MSTSIETANPPQVRNHVLAFWRRDVSQYLTEAAAATGIHGRHRGYVSTAWRFLNAGGYINFGVGEGILRRAASVTPNKGSVIVIGAGLAGVANRFGE